MEEGHHQFCQNFKYLRRKYGLTQTDLAERLGLSRASVNMIEKGKRKPSFDILLKIKTELNLSLGDLIDVDQSGLKFEEKAIPLDIPGMYYVYDTFLKSVQGDYSRLDLEVEGNPYISSMLNVPLPRKITLEDGGIERFLVSIPRRFMPESFEGLVGLSVSAYYEVIPTEQILFRTIRSKMNY
jgi:putative transcriptional regulator